MKKTITLLFTLLMLILLGGYAQEPGNSLAQKLRFDQSGHIKYIKFDGKSKTGQWDSPASAESFFKGILNASEQDDFILKTKRERKDGSYAEHYRQFYKGVEVEDGLFILHFKNGKFTKANGHYVNTTGIDPLPKLTPDAAAKSYATYLKIPGLSSLKFLHGTAIAEIKTITGEDTTYIASLCYKIDLLDSLANTGETGYIDAHTGRVLKTQRNWYDSSETGTFSTLYSGTKTAGTQYYDGVYNLVDSSRNAIVNTWDLDNAYFNTYQTNADEFTDNDNNWTHGEHSGNNDQMALDIHWALQEIYDYFDTNHQFQSFDGNNHMIDAFVHCYLPDGGGGVTKDNAMFVVFSNGDQPFFFGDGQATFKPLGALDVVAHEYAHGITHNFTGLTVNQTEEKVAMNEGFSDIWGAVIENAIAPGKDHWKIGEEVINVSGDDCLRNIQFPKSSTANTQIADTFGDDIYNDGGTNGVYEKSGVLSHWFYLLTEGGSGTNYNSNHYAVYGLGIEEAAKIVFAGQTGHFASVDTYLEARTAMEDAAAGNPMQALQVANAWYAVGVGTNPGQVIISGSNSIVGQATYVLQNLPSGLTVEWEPSNSNLSLISGQGTATATFQSDFYGECTINLKIKKTGYPDIIISKTVLADIDLDDLQNVYIDGPDFTCGPTAAFTLRNLPQPSTISWNNQSYTTDSVFIASVSSYSGSPGVAKVTAEIIYRGKPQEVEHAFNFSFNYPGTCYVEDTVMCNNGFYYDSYRDVAGVSVSYLYPASGITYEWSCNNNWTLVSGGTDYAMFEGPPTESNIDVKVCFNNPCGQRTCLVRELYMPQDLYGLLLTPNPTTFETTVSIGTTSNKSSFGKDEEWSLEVYDARQTLKTKVPRIKGNNTKIQTSGWMEGVYLVRAIWKGRVLTGKLIVKR